LTISHYIHYSVYGRGHIVSLAHSTIICAIDNPSEKFCLWMNLASFAIDEQELVSAHELMSGGAIQPMEDDVEAEAAEQEAEATAAAAAAAREERYFMPSLPCDERAASVRRMQRRSQSTKRPAKKQRVQSSNDSSDIRLYSFVVISSL
jgi:hypothetical protein